MQGLCVLPPGGEYDFGPEDILFEGKVEKQSRYLMTWRQRWAVVTPRVFCTFESKKDYGAEPTESISLTDIYNVIEEGNNGVKIETVAEGDFHLRVSAGTPSVKDWVEHLRVVVEAVNANVNAGEDPRVQKKAKQMMAPSANASQTVVQEESEECVICMEAPRRYAMVPCGHRCVCSDCVPNVFQDTPRCPVCRTEVSSCMQIFN